MILRISLLTAMLASLTFSPAATEKHLDPPNVSDGLAHTSSFYTFSPDLRRCAAPRCGGYFVKLVNQSRTRCADRRYASECYVASIDWGEQAEPDSDRALLRGSIQPEGRFGTFRVSEVWQAASANQPSGTFFRVHDRGVRCIAAPCATHQEARLNSTVHRNIAGVDLSGAGAHDNSLSEAIAGMTLPDGIIVSGFHTTVTGPAGRMPMLKATQFYLRAEKSGVEKPCMKTGCSGQVCSDQEVITTCEWRPEYECYRKAICERQKNGECGFTQTPELAECLRRARRQ